MSILKAATHQQPKTGSGFTPSRVLQRKCACGGTTLMGGQCEGCRKNRTLLSNHSTGRQNYSELAPRQVGEALAEHGTPLTAHQRRDFGERFGFDFSSVRVHTGSAAERSAEMVNAEAYTVGRHVVFGRNAYRPHGPDGRQLLAHELAHVVQQNASGHIPRDISVQDSSSPLEASADQAATAAISKLPVNHVGPSAAPAVARQEKEAPQETPALDIAAAGSVAERIVDALTKPGPVAGVGDPAAALGILRSISTTKLLVDVLIQVDNRSLNRGLLDLLVSAIGASDQSEVGAIIYAVRFTSAEGVPDAQFGVQAAKGLAQLPEDRQDAIIGQVLERRGSSVSVADIREGLTAILESDSDLDTQGTAEEEADSVPPPAILAGIAAGLWNPGKMPIPYYIGNSAHVGIAAEYASFHRGDAAFYNFSPISSILDAARALGIVVSPIAIAAAKLRLKPDIANLTRRHLYEIKPARLQSLGAAEARLYIAAFVAAGLPIMPGPVSEPGTKGTLPAPGGWFVFTAPEPGVITYNYRQPRRRRVRQPAPDPSFLQLMQRLTGLTGGALIVYIIISEGSRAFPPRNLVPIP